MDVEPLQLLVDSKSAQADLARFSSALDKAGSAWDKFDAAIAEKAPRLDRSLSAAGDAMERFGRMSALSSNLSGLSRNLNALGRLDMTKAAGSLTAFSRAMAGLRAPSDIGRLTQLNQVLGNVRAPTLAQTQRLNAFFKALNGYKPPAGLGASANMFAALGALKVPTAAQITRLDATFRTLSSVKPIPAAGQIAAQLNLIANATARMNAAAATSTNAFGQLARANQPRAGARSPLAGLGGLLGGIAGTATITRFVRDVVDASNSVMSLTKALYFSTGSVSGVANGLQSFNKTVLDLGLNLKEVQAPYSRFLLSSREAGLSLKDSEGVFRNVASALRTVGASNMQTANTFYALQEMLGKGKVQAKEFTRQFSQYVPGGAELGAEALSKVRGYTVSIAEFYREMQKGAIQSRPFVLALSDVLKQEFEPLQALQKLRPDYAINRLQSALQIFYQAVGRSDFMTALGVQLNAFTDSMVQTGQLTEKWAGVANSVGRGMAETLTVIGNAALWASDHLDLITTALKAMGAAKIATTLLHWVDSLGAMAIRTVAATAATMANTAAAMANANAINAQATASQRLAAAQGRAGAASAASGVGGGLGALAAGARGALGLGATEEAAAGLGAAGGVLEVIAGGIAAATGLLEGLIVIAGAAAVAMAVVGKRTQDVGVQATTAGKQIKTGFGDDLAVIFRGLNDQIVEPAMEAGATFGQLFVEAIKSAFIDFPSWVGQHLLEAIPGLKQAAQREANSRVAGQRYAYNAGKMTNTVAGAVEMANSSSFMQGRIADEDATRAAGQQFDDLQAAGRASDASIIKQNALGWNPKLLEAIYAYESGGKGSAATNGDHVGGYQFDLQTFLGIIKKHADLFQGPTAQAMQSLAGQIIYDPNKKAYGLPGSGPAAQANLSAISGLRRNVGVATQAESVWLTTEGQQVAKQLGLSSLSDAQAYGFHNLGGPLFSRFMRALSANPNQSVADVLGPQIVGQNANGLYRQNGRTLTVGEAYQSWGNVVRRSTAFLNGDPDQEEKKQADAIQTFMSALTGDSRNTTEHANLERLLFESKWGKIGGRSLGDGSLGRDYAGLIQGGAMDRLHGGSLPTAGDLTTDKAQALAALNTTLDREANPLKFANDQAQQALDLQRMRLKGLADEASWQERINDLIRENKPVDLNQEAERTRFLQQQAQARRNAVEAAGQQAAIDARLKLTSASGANQLQAAGLSAIASAYSGPTLESRIAQARADGTYASRMQTAQIGVVTDVAANITKQQDAQADALASLGHPDASALKAELQSLGVAGTTLAQMRTNAEALSLAMGKGAGYVMDMANGIIRANEALPTAKAMQSALGGLRDLQDMAAMSPDDRSQRTMQAEYLRMMLGNRAQAASSFSDLSAMGSRTIVADPFGGAGATIDVTALSAKLAQIKFQFEKPLGLQAWADSLQPFQDKLTDIQKSFADGLANALTDSAMGKRHTGDFKTLFTQTREQMTRASIEQTMSGVIQAGGQATNWLAGQGGILGGIGTILGGTKTPKLPQDPVQAQITAADALKTAADGLKQAALDLSSVSPGATNADATAKGFGALSNTDSSPATSNAAGLPYPLAAGTSLQSYANMTPSPALNLPPLDLSSLSTNSSGGGWSPSYPLPDLSTLNPVPNQVTSLPDKSSLVCLPTDIANDVPNLNITPPGGGDFVSQLGSMAQGAASFLGKSGVAGTVAMMGLNALFPQRNRTPVEHVVNGVIGQAGGVQTTGTQIAGHANEAGTILNMIAQSALKSAFSNNGKINVSQGPGLSLDASSFANVANDLPTDLDTSVPDLSVDGYKEGGLVGQAVNRYVVGAGWWSNAPHFSEGTANTDGGMPAVLHPNEAVIPLSRGRKVPVELNGAQGGNVTHYHSNVTVNAKDADSFRSSQNSIANKQQRMLKRASVRNLT